MSGVKGRSGRRPLRDEEKRLKIIDKAWELVGERLHSDHKSRFDLARDVVLKDITQHIKGEGISSKSITLIWRVHDGNGTSRDIHNRLASESKSDIPGSKQV